MPLPQSSGFIHFNEFLAATIQQRKLDEAKLRPAFDRLDRSHTGFINLEDVTLITGVAADAKEAAVWLKQFDDNGDGQVQIPPRIVQIDHARDDKRLCAC